MKTLASIGRTDIIYKDRFAYNAHPSITILDNGEWLVAFGHSRRRERVMHPPSDPLFRTLLTRTSDQGVTWEEPYFAPDFDWSGVEPPGVSQLSNGTVVLTQFRFGWYPLGLARKRRAAGESIFLCLPDPSKFRDVSLRDAWSKSNWPLNWSFTEDFTDDDWDRSRYSWARGYHGLHAHTSALTEDTPLKTQ